MSRLLIITVLLGCSSCSAIPEIQFIEAHGCGGSTSAIIIGQDVSIFKQDVCGYALDVGDEVVGCMVVEELSLNGIPLGNGAIAPSHDACFAEEAFGPFRPGSSGRVKVPSTARRLVEDLRHRGDLGSGGSDDHESPTLTD